MLTGDNRETAERIARELGIDEVIAEALPEEEAQKVKELEQRGWKVAMVGDGVNDAPARLGAGRCRAGDRRWAPRSRSRRPTSSSCASTARRRHRRPDRPGNDAQGAPEPGLGDRADASAQDRRDLGVPLELLVAVTALELKRLRLPRREGTLGEPEFPDSPRRALG
jgi:hypothetical protein